MAKRGTNGHKKYVWGYKVHILADTTSERPMMIDVTKDSVHDSKKATPLLAQAAYTLENFQPAYVIADAAYSSERIRRTVRNWYGTKPIIDPNPNHKKALAETVKTVKWKMIYNRGRPLKG